MFFCVTQYNIVYLFDTLLSECFNRFFSEEIWPQLQASRVSDIQNFNLKSPSICLNLALWAFECIVIIESGLRTLEGVRKIRFKFPPPVREWLPIWARRVAGSGCRACGRERAWRLCPGRESPTDRPSPTLGTCRSVSACGRTPAIFAIWFFKFFFLLLSFAKLKLRSLFIFQQKSIQNPPPAKRSDRAAYGDKVAVGSREAREPPKDFHFYFQILYL